MDLTIWLMQILSFSCSCNDYQSNGPLEVWKNTIGKRRRKNARFKQIIFSFGSFRKAENAPQEVTLVIWQAVFNLWKHGFRSPVYSFELNWVSGSVGGVTIFKSVTRRGASNYPTFIMSSVMMMMQNLMICCRNLPWIYIFLWHIMSRKDTILISN